MENWRIPNQRLEQMDIKNEENSMNLEERLEQMAGEIE